MSALRSRLFDRSDLTELLALVTTNVRRRWPAATYLLNSDVAWRLPGSRGNVCLWFDDADTLAGYAWFGLVTPSQFDLRGDLGYDHPIAREILAWLEAKRCRYPPRLPWLLDLRSMEDWERALAHGDHLVEGTQTIAQVACFDGDAERMTFLEANGYRATQHFDYYLSRSLDVPIPPCALPPEWRIRHVLDSELEARVAVHRAAWFNSTYDLPQYTRVRALGAYDRELDLVAESPSGAFASYCIAWIDEESGVGSFEPVGTATQWRGKGIGRAVQFEGLRRMKAKGMHSAKVGTAGFNHPAHALYTSCGFALADRCRTYIKHL